MTASKFSLVRTCPVGLRVWSSWLIKSHNLDSVTSPTLFSWPQLTFNILNQIKGHGADVFIFIKIHIRYTIKQLSGCNLQQECKSGISHPHHGLLKAVLFVSLFVSLLYHSFLKIFFSEFFNSQDSVYSVSVYLVTKDVTVVVFYGHILFDPWALIAPLLTINVAMAQWADSWPPIRHACPITEHCLTLKFVQFFQEFWSFKFE